MSTTTDPVTVVFSAEDAYARKLTVAARSVVATLSADLELDPCVLDMVIKAEKRHLIEGTFATRRLRLHWIAALQDGVGHLPNTRSAGFGPYSCTPGVST